MSTARPARSSSSSSSSSPVRTGTDPTPRLAACVVDAMAERKAADITVLDLRAAGGGVADFFVVATGSSDRQIRAIASAVEEDAEERLEETPWHVEGKEHARWVVLDYVNVVVHVFSREKREYYDLERLWGDADIEHVPVEDGTAAVELLQPERASSS
ncbi:MAG: ribosome silencing factor [Bacteroidetes bacterium QS_9_68_14]|nr:MAG: ribosome silencing factor [Bacteroidetes bacterium QS_9_68_14]